MTTLDQERDTWQWARCIYRQHRAGRCRGVVGKYVYLHTGFVEGFFPTASAARAAARQRLGTTGVLVRRLRWRGNR